jgi:hypothetical protein
MTSLTVSRHAVEQWCMLRYAVLVSLSQSSLLATFVRRHELAMALVAAAAQVRLDEEAKADATLRDVSKRTRKEKRAYLHEQRRERRRAKREAATYGLRRGETFEAWLQRICITLPTLGSVQRSAAVPCEEVVDGLREEWVELRPPEAVREGQPELLHSKRVAFEDGLTYEEFVAALGAQVCN